MLLITFVHRVVTQLEDVVDPNPGGISLFEICWGERKEHFVGDVARFEQPRSRSDCVFEGCKRFVTR